MSIIFLLLIMVLVFSFGLSLSTWLRVKPLSEIWGVSWLLGLGWGTMLWFLSYYLLNQMFTLTSIFGVLVLSNLVAWIPLFFFRKTEILESVNRWQHFRHTAFKILQKEPLVKWSCVALGVIFIFVFFQDIFWPVTDWDALALYDFRAKIMVITGSLAQGKQLEYFFQYPLFTSALHAWSYLTGLGIAKIWYAVIYQAGVILFYGVLRKQSSRQVSILGALFFATSPLIFIHSYTAYTNLSYAVYAGLGFIYLWRWWSDNQIKHLLLGAMLIGLSTWIRISEPFYMIALLVIAAGVLKNWKQQGLKLNYILAAIVSAGFVWFTRYPWDSLITGLFGGNVNTPLASLSLVQNWSMTAMIGRVGEVITYLWVNSAPVYLWYSLLALGLLIVDLKHKRWQVLPAWLTIGCILGAIFVGTMLLSFSLESWNRIGDSVTRMSLFLVPLWMYVIFTSPSWKDIKRK